MGDRVTLSHQMSDTDALMLRIERSPRLRSTILQVAMLDGPPDPIRMREKVLRGTAQIPRFRQVPMRALVPGAPPTWVTTSDFDVDYHLRFSRLAGRTDVRALLDHAARISVQSFDPARPLWESHVVEGLDDGGAAAIQKIHHALGDGVSLLDLVLLFVDIEREPSAPLVEPDDPMPEFSTVFARTSQAVSDEVRRAARIAASLPRSVVGLLRHPGNAVSGAIGNGRAIGRLAAPSTSKASPIMLERSMGARFDILSVSLPDMKAAAKRVGGKLNTAFVAGIAGGLGAYHEAHGVEAEAVRAAMPISTRGGGDASLGNQFSPARFALPINEHDTTRRLEMARDLTTSSRQDNGAALAAPIARILNTLPTPLVLPAFEFVMRSTDVLISNVPGSPIQLYVAGARAIANYGFSPRAGAAVNITVISHLDELHIAINSDPAAIPDPDTFVDCLRSGFDEICKAA